MVDEILEMVDTITNTTSYTDNQVAAVSVVIVVVDIYENNLRTKGEASKIVDDVITDIREGSSVLEIAINVYSQPNGSQNISWVVLEGEDNVTGLSTISAITSNKHHNDIEATTM